MESPLVPRWFLKDLEIIDATYYPEWTWEAGGWYIKKRLEAFRLGVKISNPEVGFYPQWYPDNRILDELRHRKREGQRLSLDRTPDKYLDEIMDRNREAREKAREANFQFMAEGMMEGHRMATKKTFI